MSAFPIVSLGFGCIMATASLVLYALAIGTDFWVVVTVDRDSLTTQLGSAAAIKMKAPIYHSHTVGIFRTCFSGNDLVFLDETKYKNDVVDNTCIPERIITDPSGAGTPSAAKTSTSVWSTEYVERMYLLRCQLAFLILALLCTFVGLILGIISCCGIIRPVLVMCVIFSIFGLIFGAGAMGCFHGAEYLEKTKIKDDIYPVSGDFMWRSDKDHATLASHYRRTYGYSYIIGWVAVGTSIISAIFFVIVYALSPKPAQGKNRKHKEVDDWMDKNSRGMGPQPQPQPWYNTAPAYPNGGYRY